MLLRLRFRVGGLTDTHAHTRAQTHTHTHTGKLVSHAKYNEDEHEFTPLTPFLLSATRRTHIPWNKHISCRAKPSAGSY